MKYKLQVVSDNEEHEVPDGWLIQAAFPLRTAGANATVGLLLVEAPVSGDRGRTGGGG